jgi:hypothetical protein
VDALVIWHRLRRHKVNTRRFIIAGALIVRHWCSACDIDWQHTYH